MRKYLYFIYVIVLSSCSADESSSKSEIRNHKADFILAKNIERIDWSNIQTGELLKFDVKIKDFDTSPDVQYVLKPITTDATKHQRNKLDYNFQEEIKVAASGILSSVKDSILIKKLRIVLSSKDQIPPFLFPF